MSMVANVLREVKSILSMESAWIRRANAKDREGRSIDPESKHAVCWCLNGAIMLAMKRHRPPKRDRARYLECLQEVRYYLSESITNRRSIGGISFFNDYLAKDHSEIVSVIDEAIEIFQEHNAGGDKA